VLAGIAQSGTIQSMIFFPSRRKMSVSTGTIPATKGSYVPLSSEDLFPSP
jgi:hypothetical protein